MRKIVETRIPLSNTSTIMRNPSLHNSGKGLRMIVLVSLIVLLRGYPCFHDFSHGASLHPYFIFPLVIIMFMIYVFIYRLAMLLFCTCLALGEHA